MPNRVAIYPGSFDPPTLGHLDIIQRSANMFKRVVVAVAHNDEKNSLFSVEERMDMLQEMTKGIRRVKVAQFSGLTVDFAREHDAAAIIRGLRVMSDFEYELTMAIANQKLNPDVDTVCLMSNEPHLFISSRLVKEIAAMNGSVSEYVPPHVEEQLRKKLADKD